MKYHRLFALALLTTLALPGIGYAQTETDEKFGKRWEGRVIVNVNAGLQTLSPDLAYEHVDEILSGGRSFGELSGALYVPGAEGRVVDVTAGVRLFGNFGIALTYARHEADQLAELTATLHFTARKSCRIKFRSGISGAKRIRSTSRRSI
jgi:hypothetical protein